MKKPKTVYFLDHPDHGRQPITAQNATALIFRGLHKKIIDTPMMCVIREIGLQSRKPAPPRLNYDGRCVGKNGVGLSRGR